MIRRPAHRLIIGAAVAALLSGCTADDVMRPSVDVGTTQAVPRPMPQITYTQPMIGLAQPQIVTPGPAAPALDLPTASPTAPAFEPVAPPQGNAPVLMVTPDGVVEAPSALAASAAAVPPPQIETPVPLPEDDYEVTREEPGVLARLAALPGALVPDFLKPGRSKGAEAQCRRDLKRLGVKFEDIAPVGNGGAGGCGIANPVKVSGLAGGISVKPAAVLNCRMALAFAEWVKKDVQPAARARYWSGVDTIKQMSSYSCRTIGNKRGGRLSEHSFGNAIDIGGIVLNNGKQVMVRKPGFFALRESSLLNKIRSDACDRFTTVLGPGYDRAHADHFHLDLMSRKRTSCN